MTADKSENNRRIAKNTIFLYIRMIITMLVSLYTSRIVLDVLGVDDFGIYNVVGGIVSMFAFINGAMTGVTQRFINFALGSKDTKYLSSVFSTSIQIHFLIACIIFLLAESVGLWFLNAKMNIPSDRILAGHFVYQCSILSSLVLIMSVPYNALIVAHEQMSAFAYISVLEVSLKLLVAIALIYWPKDKLMLYALLLLFIQILVRIIYSRYCYKHFKESKYIKNFDKSLFKEMLSFAGWNLWGGFSVVAFTQGLNILLNLFFSPAVNAARAVAVQIQNAVQQFATNLQMAMNPQITKSYAQGDLTYMHSLIFRSAKFTFVLLIMISLPVMLETEFLLNLWLKSVPDYTSIFLRLILCITIVDAVANPLMVGAQASGRIKVYQSVVGSVQLLILPVSYIYLKLGYAPYVVFIVHLVIAILAFIIRLFIVRPLIDLSIKEFFIKVIFKCFVLLIFSSSIPLLMRSILYIPNLLNFFIVCVVSVLSVLLFSYLFALDKTERLFLKTKFLAIVHKMK